MSTEPVNAGGGKGGGSGGITFGLLFSATHTNTANYAMEASVQPLLPPPVRPLSQINDRLWFSSLRGDLSGTQTHLPRSQID